MPDETLETEVVTPAADEGKDLEPSQDPVKAELDRENRRGSKYTEEEQAAFTLKKNADRAKELGLDPEAILGIRKEESDDSTPLTVGQYRRIEAEKAMRSAEQLADEIADPNERELTKVYLKRVVPSGNPQEDLRFARAAVNSIKNGQIAEEVARRPGASYATSGGGPGKRPEGEFIPTEEEAKFMATFKLSKEQIIAARKANEPTS